MAHDRSPLRIALIGCGQIADAHLRELRKLADVEVVAVCDRHEPLARQAAARFDVVGVFTDLTRMLAEAKPDVLHVATPPQSHRPIALEAFRAGVHVYIEKPFSIDAAEAEEIVRAARAAGVKVCVGHDQLLDPMWLQVRDMHRRDELGRIVHVDAVLGYDLRGPFGQVLSSEPNHWVHRLPGGLFQNVISHALYKVTDFLTDDRPDICAMWRDTHGVGYPTDLRAILWGEECSGSVTVTTHARPSQRVTRIYGTRRMVEVDLDAQVIRRHDGAKMPGAIAKLEVPYRQAREARRSFLRNVKRFIRSDIHFFAGMRALFEQFYASIRGLGPDPISTEEIVRVTAIMDDIFDTCRQRDTRRAEPATEAVAVGGGRVR